MHESPTSYLLKFDKKNFLSKCIFHINIIFHILYTKNDYIYINCLNCFYDLM